MPKQGRKVKAKPTVASVCNAHNLTPADNEKQLIEPIRNACLSESLSSPAAPAATTNQPPDKSSKLESVWSKALAGWVVALILPVCGLLLAATRMNFQPVIVLQMPDIQNVQAESYAKAIEKAVRRRLQEFGAVKGSPDWQREPLGLLPVDKVHYSDVIHGAKTALPSFVRKSEAFLRYVLNRDQRVLDVDAREVGSFEYHYGLSDDQDLEEWKEPPSDYCSSRRIEGVADDHALKVICRVEPETVLRGRWGPEMSTIVRDEFARRELKRRRSLVSALVLIVDQKDGKKPPELGGKDWTATERALLDTELMLQERFAPVGTALDSLKLADAIKLLKAAERDPSLEAFALTQEGLAYMLLAEKDRALPQRYWQSASKVFQKVESQYPTARYYRLKAQILSKQATADSVDESLEKCADLMAPFGTVGIPCPDVLGGLNKKSLENTSDSVQKGYTNLRGSTSQHLLVRLFQQRPTY
jgi:hypothetical protein